MTVTELTKEIYEKYPKVSSRLTDFFIDNNIINHNDFGIEVGYEDQSHNNLCIFIIDYLNDNGFEIPFSMLYVLLEDFFEENGLILIIEFDYNRFEYRIDNYMNKPYIKPVNSFESKIEAKTQAILKACEILNNELKE